MPPKSKAQARLMRAVAQGDVKLKGMSEEEAQEYVEHHKTKHLPEHVHKSLINRINNFVQKQLNPYDAKEVIRYVQKNPNLDDSDFHSFVQSRGLDPHEAEEEIYRFVQRMSKKVHKMDNVTLRPPAREAIKPKMPYNGGNMSQT